MIMSSNQTHTEVIPAQYEAELITLIATFRTPAEISKWAKKRGLNIGVREIKKYTEDPVWSATLEKMRTSWNARMFELALSNKRARIEEFSYIYGQLKRERQFSEASRQLINIRHEIEGEAKDGRPNIYNLQYNQFMNMSDEEVEKERLSCLTELKKLKEQFPGAIQRTLLPGEVNQKRSM